MADDPSDAASSTTLSWHPEAAPRPTTRRRKYFDENAANQAPPPETDSGTALSAAPSVASVHPQHQRQLRRHQNPRFNKTRPGRLKPAAGGRGCGGDEFFDAALNKKLRVTLGKLYRCLNLQRSQPCRNESDTCLSDGPICPTPLEDIDCGVRKLACILLIAVDRMPPGKCHDTNRCTRKMGCACPRCRSSDWFRACCEMLRCSLASLVEGVAGALSCILGCTIHSLTTGRILGAVVAFLRPASDRPARVAAVRERMCQVSQIYQRVRERLRPENVVLFSRVVTLVYAKLEEHERAATGVCSDRPRAGEWMYDEVGGCYDDRGGYYDSYGGYYDSSGGYYDEFGGYYNYNGDYFQAGRC